jgi:hypothetical protein
MKVKLNHRLPQAVDRLTEFETGVEEELRRRLQLTGAYGIVSADGVDVDTSTAACALAINSTDSSAFDVAAGTVVFANGEFVEVSSTDLQAVPVNLSVTDGQVVRLEYGEVDDGPLEANPYFNFAALPKRRKKTPAEMLVVETVTTYNAQTAAVKALSVVLGVLRVTTGELEVDNGRDTYTWSRPWFSPTDTTHRSQVGTGLVGPTNPHGMSANDLSVGNFSMWQALVGPPACVIARPTGWGRFPGTICTETVLAGAFASDTTGFVTGKAGASYQPLGFWPDRLLSARRSSDGVNVSAWIPKGRNVIAVYDPVFAAVPQDLDLYYTRVDAGALPGSFSGLTAFDVTDPNSNEVLVAGGNFFATLNEKRVLFTDVGLIPMKFDIMVDGAGKVYKNPDIIYCNTTLDTLGSSPVSFTIQPRAPSRLRFAISNYNMAFTSIQFLMSGKDEAGGVISETVTFTGPASLPPGTSFVEETFQRMFTENVYAEATQVQVIVRNGDGPNTTLTVFAEGSPERPGTQDDLLLATVQWTGSQVTAAYGSDPDTAIDRRLVTRGGGSRGLSTVGGLLNQPMLVESALGYLPTLTTKWATIVEDFNDSMWMEYPNKYMTTVTPSQRPVELMGASLGARFGYLSRKIPFADTIAWAGGADDAAWMRLVPKSQFSFPARMASFGVTVRLFRTAGADVVLTGTLGTNPYPPYQVNLSGGPIPAASYYAMNVEIADNVDFSEAFQGFIFHIRA